MLLTSTRQTCEPQTSPLSRKQNPLMNVRASLTVGSAVVALLLAGCSGSDADNTDTAAKVCNDTLKQAGEEQDFEAMLKRDTENADVAAELAQDDEQWDDLASAISDVAAVEKEAQGAVEEMIADDTGVGMARAQEVLNDLTDAKRGLLSECRKVKAAGGEVSQDLLDNYIK